MSLTYRTGNSGYNTTFKGNVLIKNTNVTMFARFHITPLQISVTINLIIFIIQYSNILCKI